MPDTDLPRLTQREREVAGYVLNGSSNKVIAIDLGISLRTVEAHRARIFHKFGVRHAVAFAHLFYRLKEPDLLDSYLSAQARNTIGSRDGHVQLAAGKCHSTNHAPALPTVVRPGPAHFVWPRPSTSSGQPQFDDAEGASSIGSRSG